MEKQVIDLFKNAEIKHAIQNSVPSQSSGKANNELLKIAMQFLSNPKKIKYILISIGLFTILGFGYSIYLIFLLLTYIF